MSPKRTPDSGEVTQRQRGRTALALLSLVVAVTCGLHLERSTPEPAIPLVIQAPMPEHRVSKEAERSIAESLTRVVTSAVAASARAECLAPLPRGRIPRSLVRRAIRLLIDNFEAPYGSTFRFVHNGRNYVARIEQHFHPEGGTARPWGHHRGVTVYAVREVRPPIQETEDGLVADCVLPMT